MRAHGTLVVVVTLGTLAGCALKAPPAPSEYMAEALPNLVLPGGLGRRRSDRWGRDAMAGRQRSPIRGWTH